MNGQEMKVRLTNGSLFQLIGSDNIDSLMGTNPKIVVFSEYALQDPAAWDYIRPILKVNGGVAIFISTPRGRNHFYELFRTAQTTEGWFHQKLTIEDTGVLTPADVAQEQAEGMSEELALQEYYCSFDRGVEGSYYAKLLNKMNEQERICPVRYDPEKMVYTSWDLGWDDSTAVLFFQLHGTDINIFDCEEHSNKTLGWFKELLMRKGYKYGAHLFPHDVEQIDGLSTGCTRKEILEDLQIPVTTVPKGLIADGIETVKGLLASRIRIDDKKCRPLIKALENYHKDWDDKHKVYSNKPRHDWSSHYCFTGDTKVLTRNGTHQIMDLSHTGEVLTRCGWKQYKNPTMTRKDAQLVAVKFVSGITVRCTPDHMFLTEKGWKSAESLTPYTEIQSSLMNLPNTLTEGYTEYGQEKSILQEVGRKYIEIFGLVLLERYLKNVIFTIKTVIQRIIDSITSNASMEGNICPSIGLNIKKEEKLSFLMNVVAKQQIGMDQKREGYGIKETQKELRIGQNGKENPENAQYVKMNSNVLLDQMDMNKNTAIPIAKPLLIESVTKLNEVADVWCINVPDSQEFSLENGAIVHNCDALRYLAEGLNKIDSRNVSTGDELKAVNAFFRY